jgi:hypothetical protein
MREGLLGIQGGICLSQANSPTICSSEKGGMCCTLNLEGPPKALPMAPRLVPSLKLLGGVGNFKKWEPSERSLGHWGYALRGDLCGSQGTPVSPWCPN